MPMLRFAIAILACVVVSPAVAHAALPAAHPPTSAQLRAKKVQLTWPLTDRARLPGFHVIRIPVRSLKHPVTLSLVEVDRRGRTIRTLERETLRRGMFEAYIAEPGMQRLALRLRVGRSRYWSWITAVAERTMERIACEHGVAMDPVLSLGGTPLRSGRAFVLELQNPGRCPLGVVAPLVYWQRPVAGGGWELVPTNCEDNSVRSPGDDSPTMICDRLPVSEVVAPGAVRVFPQSVPSGLAPGHYRIAIDPYPQPTVFREVDVVV